MPVPAPAVRLVPMAAYTGAFLPACWPVALGRWEGWEP